MQATGGPSSVTFKVFKVRLPSMKMCQWAHSTVQTNDERTCHHIQSKHRADPLCFQMHASRTENCKCIIRPDKADCHRQKDADMRSFLQLAHVLDCALTDAVLLDNLALVHHIDFLGGIFACRLLCRLTQVFAWASLPCSLLCLLLDIAKT